MEGSVADNTSEVTPIKAAFPHGINEKLQENGAFGIFRDECRNDELRRSHSAAAALLYFSYDFAYGVVATLFLFTRRDENHVS